MRADALRSADRRSKRRVLQNVRLSVYNRRLKLSFCLQLPGCRPYFRGRVVSRRLANSRKDAADVQRCRERRRRRRRAFCRRALAPRRVPLVSMRVGRSRSLLRRAMRAADDDRRRQRLVRRPSFVRQRRVLRDLRLNAARRRRRRLCTSRRNLRARRAFSRRSLPRVRLRCERHR